jgi:hypothetical protein
VTSGRAASDVAVALYALLARADHPLTFAEICAGLPSAFRNDATREYKEWAKGQSDNHVNAIKGDLPDEVRQRAWEWWVEKQVELGRIKKRLIVTTKPGITKNTRHARLHEKVWSANPNKPPKVTVVVYTQHTQQVDWTPEGAGDAAPRQVVKARYLNANDEMLEIVNGLRTKDKDRLAEHLQNGAFALDDHRSPPT